MSKHTLYSNIVVEIGCLLNAGFGKGDKQPLDIYKVDNICLWLQR